MRGVGGEVDIEVSDVEDRLSLSLRFRLEVGLFKYLSHALMESEIVDEE